MTGRDMSSVAWDQVSHAYGPAADMPEWIRGLRGPDAADCLSLLYSSITHQGTRYSATPLCAPFLVDAARDPAVVDRLGVVLLVQFCAMGYSGDELDWRIGQLSGYRAAGMTYTSILLIVLLVVTLPGTVLRHTRRLPGPRGRQGPDLELIEVDPISGLDRAGEASASSAG